MSAPDEIDALRKEIRALDKALVDLAAKRTALARRVGEVKRDAGLPIRNYTVEADAIRLARDEAASLGLPPELAEEMVTLLIRESLRAQERDRRRATRATASTGRRALVVGGAGNMGRWFAEFFDSKGFSVSVADPRGTPAGYATVQDVPGAAHAFDVIVVATPPSAVGPVLRSLVGKTRGLVFEIGSLKAPFLEDLKTLAASGAAVTSVHPMWGPRTDLLASKNVVICRVGNAEADRAARSLFEDTAANVVELPIDEHDTYMARVLGLPHASNLVFGHAMKEQGMSLAALAHLGGPTFVKQLAVTREVVSENKDLYHEIQRLNPHTKEMLSTLRRSLDAFERAVASREAFRAYMSDAERFFEEGSR